MQRKENILWSIHAHFLFFLLPHFSLLFWLRLISIHGSIMNGCNFRLHSCSFLYLHNKFTCSCSLCKGLSISLPTFLSLFFNDFLHLKIEMYRNSNALFYRPFIPFSFKIIYGFAYCAKKLVFCLMSLLHGKPTQQSWINIESYKRLFSKVEMQEGSILRRANICEWTAEV